MKLHENREISCNVLMSFIENETDPHIKKMYIRDFHTKNDTLLHALRNGNLLKFLKIMIDPDYKSIAEEIISEPNNVTDNERNESDKEPENDKLEIDIAIITIKQPELIAAKVALGIDPADQNGDHQHRGYRYWFSKITCEGNQNNDWNVVLTMVGQARNVNCANACRTLFEQYNVKTCVLVGMAAGPKSEVKLGDVVVAEQVYDYEGGRVEEEGIRKRPVPFKINRIISRHLDYFDPSLCKWHDIYYANLEQLKQFKEIPENSTNQVPSFMKKIILSGEKVIVDESMEQRKNDMHDETRALEMEASGFAATCEECGKHWLVFRGISDFGDPATKDKQTPQGQHRKVWQATASLAAASALITFLRHSYTHPSENEIF